MFANEEQNRYWPAIRLRIDEGLRVHFP